MSCEVSLRIYRGGFWRLSPGERERLSGNELARKRLVVSVRPVVSLSQQQPETPVSLRRNVPPKCPRWRLPPPSETPEVARNPFISPARNIPLSSPPYTDTCFRVLSCGIFRSTYFPNSLKHVFFFLK